MSKITLKEVALGELLEKIPDAEYRGWDALSVSSLKEASKSWAHFFEYKKNPPEPTKAMEFGKAFHLALEHQSDWQKFIVADESFEGRTKEARAAKDKFLKSNAGKIILSLENYQHLQNMVEVLLNDSEARQFLVGKPEVSARWVDKKTGVALKSRFDRLIDDVIVDYKTTQDASVEQISRDLFNRKYHWQSAFYLDALKACSGISSNKFVHIFVEKTPPYAFRIVYLPDRALELARSEYLPLLEQYSMCRDEGYFPSYPATLQEIDLPTWAYKGGLFYE